MAALTVAIQRSDRTEALFRGDVAVEGFEVNLVSLTVSEIFNRMLRHGEFEASEMSFAYGLIAHGRHQPDFVTLPFYPYRTFRHSSLFVRDDGSVRGPADLPGKTFAVHDFFAADPLWIRGTLRDVYGVDPRSIHWLQYQFNERLSLPQDTGYDLTYDLGKDPSDLLLSGQADVAFCAALPAALREGTGLIRPLFDDPLAEESTYFQNTGCLPLLHGFVVRRDVYEAQPDLAMALYRALVASRDAWYRAVLPSPSVVSGMPLFTSLVLKVQREMGADFWPAGLQGNRVALERGIAYAAEDGLIPAAFDPADLFPTEFRDS
jgi:4,5-dihydroxyphthalate decarboxylase